LLQNKGKGKGKGKNRAVKDVEDNSKATEDNSEMKTEIVKLKALDVFAGCGGEWIV
jgi:plasmid rolling circle replication initiator protein Rep